MTSKAENLSWDWKLLQWKYFGPGLCVFWLFCWSQVGVLFLPFVRFSILVIYNCTHWVSNGLYRPQDHIWWIQPWLACLFLSRPLKDLYWETLGTVKVFLKAYNTKLSRKLLGYLDEDNSANYIKVMVKIVIELD